MIKKWYIDLIIKKTIPVGHARGVTINTLSYVVLKPWS